MATYFTLEGNKYELPSDCNLSIGDSCDITEKRMSDGSGTSYSITTFNKPQPITYSLSFVRSRMEVPNIVDDLQRWESLVGENVSLTYCDIPIGNIIVSDLSVSFSLDSIAGIIGLAITLNLRENLVITKKSDKIKIENLAHID